LNETETTESWLSRRVAYEIKDLTSQSRSHPRIAIAGGAVLTLVVFYLCAHQVSSTGFFTATFSTSEMLLLYGSLIEWIGVAVLEALGRKNLSRDIDAFGRIIFVTISGIWLFVVFPFEFTYFADVLPDFLRFLVQWISNDIARGIIVLWTIVNGVAAVYYGILGVSVRKALSARTSVLKD
jgi:hypothetical protein